MSESPIFDSTRWVIKPIPTMSGNRVWAPGLRPKLRLQSPDPRPDLLNRRNQVMSGESFIDGTEGELAALARVTTGEASSGRWPAVSIYAAYYIPFLILVAIFCLSASDHSLSMGTIIYWTRSGGTNAYLVTAADHARRIEALESALHRLSRDHIGLQDFASRYSGGQVISDLTTSNSHRRFLKNDVIVALDDDLRVGRCWRIEGSSGQIGVLLADKIYISHVTVDHVAKELVSNIGHAPRNMILWGVVDESEASLGASLMDGIISDEFAFPEPKIAPLISKGLAFLPLSWIRYDIAAQSHIQTFPVFSGVTLLNVSMQTVVLEILDNWGDTWTCLYRIRVHGHLAT